MAPKAGRNLVAGDAAILEGAAKLFAYTYDDMNAFGEYIEKINSRMNTDPKKAGIVLPGEEKRLSPEGDQLVKDMAGEYIKKIDSYVSQELDTKPASRATEFHKEILRAYKRDLENVGKGISIVQDPELNGTGRGAVTDYFPQMSSKALAPDQIENTSKALEQFPVDQYLKIGNDLRDMEEGLELERDSLSPDEISKRSEAIRDKKRELLEVAKDLYEKSKDPTPETISLFDGRDCLDGPNGFMHQRGLEDLIFRLEREEARRDWEKKGIPQEMGEFSTEIANAVDIYGPNPKHHEAWGPGGKSVYNKEDFERDLESYDAAGLPFTETELSLIGMAYTGLETKDNIEARKKCPKPGGTDRENLEGNTFWTSDLMDSEVGPRGNLVRYSPMLQAGRAGAQKVAKAYAAGDKKQLAEVIQSSFRIQQKSTLKEAGIGTTSAGLNYLSQKTFLDMLERDPELKREFDAVNESVPAGDKVDIDSVRAQCENSKIALDKINARRELDRHPLMAEERKRELQKKILTADIMTNIAEEEKRKQSNHPDYIRKMNEQQKQMKALLKDPSRMAEYSTLMSRFLDETNKQSEILPYLASEAGRKRLDAFADRMTETFGPTLLSETVNNRAEYARSQAEMQKLTLELLKEKDLAKLSSGQELTAEEKKQIVSDYIRRDIASEGYDRFLKTGEKNRYLEMLGGNATEDEKNGILPYDDKLKGVIDNMGLENMEPAEIGEMLKVGAYREVTDKIEQSAELEFEKGKRTDPAPRLDDALGDLQAGKEAAWFGKADYNNALSDFAKMNDAYRKSGKEIYEKGTDAIDPELRKKQEDLLARMDAYMARKDQEFARNKERGRQDNANSRMRYDAMSKARKALKERMAYDDKINGLVAADQEFKEYSASVAEWRGGKLENEQAPASQVREKTTAKEEASVQQAREKAPARGKAPAQEKAPEKQSAPHMKKFDKEIKKFRQMSAEMLHSPVSDAGALGLNSWEFQAAKVVAIAGIEQGLEQGKLQPNEIEQEMRKNVRRIGSSQEFKDWAKEVQKNPEKMKQLGKMSPENVRMDFVTSMSKNMEKQNEGPKREVPKKEGVIKNNVKKPELKKVSPKLVEPVRQGP